MDKKTKVGFAAVRERFSRYIAIDTRSNPQIGRAHV